MFRVTGHMNYRKMFDQDIDMEDLEARLYGQVHYSNYNEDGSKTNDEPKDSQPQQPYFANFQTVPNIYAHSVHLMLNPAAFNNVVVVQPPATHILTNSDLALQKSEMRRAKRLRRKERKRRLKPNKCVFRKHRLGRVLPTVASKESGQNEINDDRFSCEIVEPKRDTVVISSDDENVTVKPQVGQKATDGDDDVVFVETKGHEIINIDCDDEITVNDNVTSVCTEQNDFLEDSTLINNNAHEVNFINPSSTQNNQNEEVSDSESSCTTSNSQNRIFKEASFEASNKDVSSLSLDDFENYITTLGKSILESSASKVVIASSTPRGKIDKRLIDKNNANSSDSSSESDYEDKTATNQVKQNLPNLSPIVSDVEVEVIANCDTNMDIINSKYSYKTVQADSQTNAGDTSVVCLSSSDEQSDLEVVEMNSIELLNIEGTKMVPKQDLSSSHSRSAEISRFSDYWKDDMNEFYNESWGQENFSCEDEQKKMSDDPKLWKIIDKDYINPFATPRGPRCHRCRQFGHLVLHCPNKSDVPKCILCGQSGHYESKCPNKICAACGVKIPSWTIYCRHCSNARHVFCNICSMPQHTSKHCPDLWRRYHLTVSEGPIICPKKQTVKAPQDRWCCACASQGHYEHECNYVIRNYARTVPFVHSYEDVYNDSKRSSNQNVQNFVSQPAIPSLLDLHIDKNEIIQQQQVIPTQLNLPKFEALRLLKRKGIAFLKNLTKATDLQIKVMKCGKSRPAKYVCIINGSDTYRSKAVSEIKEFCTISEKEGTLLGIISRKGLTRNRLMNQFHGMRNNKRPWTRLIKNTYNEILKCEEKICSESTGNDPLTIALANYYTALNAVLINKFKVGNQRSLKLLKRWLHSNSTVTDKIQRAYKYVFLNSEKIIDYQKLIQNMVPDEGSTSIVNIDLYKILKTSRKLCHDMHLNKELTLLNNYYRLILQSNFDDQRINIFKKFCKCLKLKNSK